MHIHYPLTRADAAKLVAFSFVLWLVVPFVGIVAVAQLACGEFRAAKESTLAIGMFLAAPFIYGWQVIAGPNLKD